MKKKLNLIYIFSAFLVCVPWLVIRFGNIHVSDLTGTIISAIAIVGASFIISWGAELAQLEISQSLSLILVALLAVLPEYAVDFYLSWMAGKDPAFHQYPVANMTGSNRLLIGIGWSAIVLIAYFTQKGAGKTVRLEKKNSLEIVILLVATIYSFIIPIKGSITIYDSIILFLIFAVYLIAAAKIPHEEPTIIGILEDIAILPRKIRKFVNTFFFLFAGFVIFVSVEHFANGLISIGKTLGINEFFLIQWLAPLASEAPELIIAGYFAIKGHISAGFGTLVSSKVNQWTLLIGSIPIVYSVSIGRLTSFTLDRLQIEEILLTSAQSFFALAIIGDLEITVQEALILLGLFLLQLFMPNPLIRFIFSGIYILWGAVILIKHRKKIREHFNILELLWKKN